MPIQTSVKKQGNKTFVSVYEQPLIKLLYPFYDYETTHFSVKWSNSNDRYFETQQTAPLLIAEVISWLHFFEDQIHSVEATLQKGLKIDSNFHDECFFEIDFQKDPNQFVLELENACSPNFTFNLDLPSVPKSLRTIEF
ncbi:MAG: hypothetical protein JXQ87_04285 [Bacteroidia bacterium]